MGDELRDYRGALQYLFARTTGGSKYGLQRTEALLAALGDPHRALRAFHVAGTNGKGSVCATLAALLRARGLRTGTYSSPHLVDFRERIVVDGAPVPGAYVVEFVQRWVPTIERLGATFFEATTAMAFAYLADRQVDVAVIETGLGGRLDSTNVLHPLVAGVTSIGLDHTEILGDTREAIAVEKAGIFKAGVPAAIGEPDAAIATQLEGLAASRGASACVRVWRDAPPVDVVVDGHGTRFEVAVDGARQALHTPLAGAHQASNATLAALMLRAAGPPYWDSWEAVARALPTVRLPGRFHVASPYIFDVAHNPDGVDVLARTLARVAPAAPVVALVCVLGDKDWRGILDRLAPQVAGFVLTDAPTVPSSRSWRLDDVLAYARTRGYAAEALPDFDAALGCARARGATVLVTGSFHTVGDAMDRLQVNPLGG